MIDSKLLTKIPAALVAATFAFAPAAATAVETEFGLKLKAGGLSEDSRDLQETGEGYEAGFLDLQPQLHTMFSDNFAHFMRVQAFIPSDMVTTDEQGEPVEVETYAAVREFWVEFGGITSYPGEAIRAGLQRLREPGGLWYDRDIETARWIFDTTLFQFEMGAAKAFNTYRSDDIELPESQKDRAYGFLGIGTQWIPGNYVGARAAYATDQRELPPNGTQTELRGTYTDSTGATVNNWVEPEARDYAWVGVFLDNRFYDWERGPGLSYRVELIGMRGQREYSQIDPTTGVITGQASEDVDALGGEAGLRARFPDAFPLTLGAAYAFGEGGSDGNGSHQFRQTGLQSNRSRFTGTRTMLNRFNEALQADLTNLRVSQAFVALPLQSFDVSFVGSSFKRDDATAGVSTDGIDARPTRPSTDLGTGIDAVVTYYFAQLIRQEFAAEDDTRSNVRLRASRFAPGDAYEPGLSDQTRVMLEGTLWF